MGRASQQRMTGRDYPERVARAKARPPALLSRMRYDASDFARAFWMLAQAMGGRRR